MPKPTSSKKVSAHLLTELSRNHSKLSRLNMKKVKLSRREQLSNSLIQLWEDKRRCILVGLILINNINCIKDAAL
jgi:hypothetical protein